MSPLALRRLLRTSQRRLGLAFAIAALAGAVLAHHGMPMDMHMAPATTCVAVLVLGFAVLRAVAVRVARPLPRVSFGRWGRAVGFPAPKTVPARAGPLYLRLGVIRR